MSIDEIKQTVIDANPRVKMARLDYLKRVSEPFVQAAEKLITTSKYKILVTPDGKMKYIYPYNTLKALVELRTLYRQATEIKA